MIVKNSRPRRENPRWCLIASGRFFGLIARLGVGKPHEEMARKAFPGAIGSASGTSYLPASYGPREDRRSVRQAHRAKPAQRQVLKLGREGAVAQVGPDQVRISSSAGRDRAARLPE